MGQWECDVILMYVSFRYDRFERLCFMYMQIDYFFLKSICTCSFMYNV